LRDQGLNLIEKIAEKKADIKKQGLVKSYDGYFTKENDHGQVFYKRVTDLSTMATHIHKDRFEVPETDFSAAILIEEEGEEESSEEEDIPDQMDFQNKGMYGDYDAFKEFYGQEIDGKFHRRREQVNLEKAKKRAAMGDVFEAEMEEETKEEKEGEGEEGEGEGEGEDIETQSQKAKRELEERLEKERVLKEEADAAAKKKEREALKDQKFLQLLEERKLGLPTPCQ